MKKLDIIKKDSASTTIGVLGTAHGAGVTHLSLMLAVFMALVMGKSVALADMSGTDCLRQAGIMLKNNFRRKSKIFKMIQFMDRLMLHCCQNLCQRISSTLLLILVPIIRKITDNSLCVK